MNKKDKAKCINWLKRGWKIEKELTFLKGEQERTLTDAEDEGDGACRQALFYTKRIAKRMEALFSVKLELFEAISALEKQEHRLLLSLRYLNCLTWEEIADILEVDVRHVYRLHEESLADLKMRFFEM